MIRAAIAATRWFWPDPPSLGMVTFVDRAKVRHKRDYGRCYLRAGFKVAGETEGGLLAFQMVPEAMPEPCAPYGVQFSLADGLVPVTNRIPPGLDGERLLIKKSV
jgi:hypothetical protein